MTKEDIIKMAREAGIEFYPSPTNDVRFCLLKNLERFAALVAAHEREACSKACAELLSMVNSGDEHSDGVTDCIAAIRARGEK